jgi:putative membrane protein
MKLTQQDHRLVTDAIAERHSSAEIVVVATASSDPYTDVALHWAAVAALAVPVLVAVLPAAGIDALIRPILGWHADDITWRLVMLFVVQVLVFLIVRTGISETPLRYWMTPAMLKAGRVRRRALATFQVSTEARTHGRNGVLIYLSLAEHRAELVADAAVHASIPHEAWGAVMAVLVDAVADGRPGEGLAAAVTAVGDLLEPHFPPGSANPNEIPDRLIEV